MKKILILGGTRFLGVRFIELFRDQYHITCATRGHSSVPSGVAHLTLDRFNPDSCKKAFAQDSYEAVIDTLCFDAQHASSLTRYLDSRAGKILMISSRSVYGGEGPFNESHFDPISYPVTLRPAVHSVAITPGTDELPYGEGKREAEAYLARYSAGPSTSIRFPILIGKGDYTGRLLWHLARIKEGVGIDFGESGKKTSFITVDDAARSLQHLIEDDTTGPINLASPPVTLDEVLEAIEAELGKKILKSSAGERSPYALSRDTSLDCGRAQALGFSFTDILSEFQRIVRSER